MARSGRLSQNTYWRKEKIEKTRQLQKVKRNKNLATVLYVRSRQAIDLNIAVYCHLKERRIKRKLILLRHPDSFRLIFPDYKRVDFSSFHENVFRDLFRFPKGLCFKIRNYFRLRGFGDPVRVSTGRNRQFYTFKLEELILIYLRRMAVPDRLVDVAKVFGRCMEEISVGSIYMCEEINILAKEFLDGRAPYWDQAQAQYNADLINAFDVPLRDVCLLFDGSLEAIENPWKAEIQARYYSGYIRRTANKVIVAVCAQGLYIFVSGWSEGRRHDMAVALRYNMYPRLRALTQFPTAQFKSYADSAFRSEHPVYTPFQPSDTPRKREFNKQMARVRITAEWAFQINRSIWPAVKHTPRQKILQGKNRGNLPGKNLYNSFWLTNLHSCYNRGNIIAGYFGATLPTLEQYLGVQPNDLD